MTCRMFKKKSLPRISSFSHGLIALDGVMFWPPLCSWVPISWGYEWICVSRLSQEPDIWRDHLLPRFHTLDAAQRLVQMEYLRDHSDIITEGGPEDLLQALGRAPFIPTEDGGFLAAQELIDPRNEVLCSVFDNSDRRFPGAEFATPVWLPFLELIGMKTQIDTDLLLEAAQAIEKHQDDVAEVWAAGRLPRGPVFDGYEWVGRA